MQAGERRVQWIQSKSLRLCGAVFSAYANMPTLRKLLLDIQQTQKNSQHIQMKLKEDMNIQTHGQTHTIHTYV